MWKNNMVGEEKASPQKRLKDKRRVEAVVAPPSIALRESGRVCAPPPALPGKGRSRGAVSPGLRAAGQALQQGTVFRLMLSCCRLESRFRCSSEGGRGFPCSLRGSSPGTLSLLRRSAIPRVFL